MSVEKLIVDHMETWTSALQTRSTAGRGSSGKIDLYGIKKLRELILELAVRGKLVPQDPNDEPASKLLKRIAAEKAELVKQGKIKKQKPLPEISEEEKPFELPEGWEWTRLINLGIWALGSGFPNVVQGSTDKEILMCKVSDMNLEGNEKFIFSTKNTISKDLADEYKIKISEPGTIIFPKIGGAIATNKRRILVQDTAIDNNCLGIKPCDAISGEWFYLILNTLDMSKYQSGTSIPAINQSVIGSIPIALPSLKMQEKIVSYVITLMSLCDQLEQQSLTSLDAHQQLVETLLGTLTDSQNAEELAENWARISEHFDTLFTTEASVDALKQTILQLAVMGKLLNNTNNADYKKLRTYLSFGPKNGLSPVESKKETQLKVLKLGATSYGQLNLNETKFIDVDIEKDSHLFLKKGDILIQRGNSANFVGCNVLINEDYKNIIYPDLMMKIRTNDNLLPEYASIWLSSPLVRNFMWDRMTGTSGTMPKISKKIVEEIPIIVPEISIQQKWITTVNLMLDICSEIKYRLHKAKQTQLHLADALTDAAIN
ncbi:restriction endonuclease subunit S [Escherichia coli]|uniref:restriction endonuclease subunit S n=2 Tax=Escherichia coli TaxID=562 RepID=UPI0015E4F214|nr:restriction endonuclease subunit S [Escherichia coli]EEV6034266.1 restriction endonuclease subunit S [Escherichia coli]EFM6526640.1 restriction endonuclease subunit S [Escherichia coli]EHE8532288.1 restriction endonuclease subunit S [Escherichia coli]EHK3811369.1 restriction endonuclease subunit S [Escherichia coli]EIH9917462.1 restriction endonuclease subunit S [Escherichia coli]